MAEHGEDVYRALVVDSGPIIRLTGATSLWKKANSFYTVPAVVQEIRDAKARQHLETLPFELKIKEPSPESIHAIVEFARKTGDYASLSSVDIQVLGLVYELERECCRGDMNHIRREPKRIVGIGKIESLGKETKEDIAAEEDDFSGTESEGDCPDDDSTGSSRATSPVPCTSAPTPAPTPTQPKTWAALVNPKLGSSELPTIPDASLPKIEELGVDSQIRETDSDQKHELGQFSDAEDVETGQSDGLIKSNDQKELEKELMSDFPSLAASLLVPYEGSDDEGEQPTKKSDLEEQRRRSLQPVSKSGKLYNSFTRYGALMQPKPVATKIAAGKSDSDSERNVAKTVQEINGDSVNNKNNSRITGGVALSGQDGHVEDDGKGWISSTKEIMTMKAAGMLDPLRNPSNNGAKDLTKGPQGPPLSQRAACSTTDFAMQNVLLQMNLELLSIDGMKVRKLKSWVTRCGACFKVYTTADSTNMLGEKRLFCERCGSDMMQRIAASVDAKSGRLRLHLSKRYTHNLRGTKFSLPKPGTGNRFQGDLLLREDQLLMGAWNQKLKMRSGGKARSAAESIFGNDIASNVGCHTKAMTMDDIKVGFGRRNPNAAKGRERRGKKKKSSEKACGLRRY